MACGSCGGRRGPVSSPDSPRQFGEPDGVVTRVRATINYRQLRPGEIAWVTGTGVAALLEGRILVAI